MSNFDWVVLISVMAVVGTLFAQAITDYLFQRKRWKLENEAFDARRLALQKSEARRSKR